VKGVRHRNFLFKESRYSPTGASLEEKGAKVSRGLGDGGVGRMSWQLEEEYQRAALMHQCHWRKERKDRGESRGIGGTAFGQSGDLDQNKGSETKPILQEEAILRNIINPRLGETEVLLEEVFFIEGEATTSDHRFV